MIRYDRLWETMKQRGVSQYDLYTHHNINRSQLDRLRKTGMWRSTPSTVFVTFSAAGWRTSWSTSPMTTFFDPSRRTGLAFSLQL